MCGQRIYRRFGPLHRFHLCWHAAAVTLPVLLLNAAMASGAMLPEHLGEYSRGRGTAAYIPAGDRGIFIEYGLTDSEHADYTNDSGRRMAVDAFRFGDSEGGHAAFLMLRPLRAVGSPLQEYSDLGGAFGQTHAVVGAGLTIAQRKNFVFRFRHASPDSGTFRVMLKHLGGFDPAEASHDECCRYYVEGSDRLLLGPASLAKFAPRISPSAAEFELGGKGRLAAFETPAGRMALIVFEYPVTTLAIDRATAFRRIPGSVVRRNGKKIGVIFDPRDQEEAELLLRNSDGASAGEAPGWDPRFEGDVLTLDGGMGMVFMGFALGSVMAFFGHLAQWRNGMPNRIIKLGLGRGLV
jgi:hypothetical protein